MPITRGPEDGCQAGGYHSARLDGQPMVEEFLVKRTPDMIAIHLKPALIVRYYDGGVVTLSEGEWIDRA